MAPICQDLATYGVVLIPPASEKYFQLLADIEQRLRSRPKGAPPVEADTLDRIFERAVHGSAILLNQAQVSIASVAFLWSFRLADGRIVDSRFLPGSNPSALLPFGIDDRTRKFRDFWHTIFPGSKRLMAPDGSAYGDNTDVRAPAEDELWHGSFFGVGSNAQEGEPVKLTLDGVFFTDGGFAGPNQLGSWEHTTFAAETYLACAQFAREARERAAPLDAFFVQIREFTGYEEGLAPPPPFGPLDPELIRRHERWNVGAEVGWTRKHLGDEGAIVSIAGWGGAPAPRLHRL